MKVVLVGYGEVGRALYEVFSPFAQIEICDVDKKPIGEFEMMFVAIPYTENFVNIVQKYKEDYKVKKIIVFSTVAIGTCDKIGAIHSPVEGKHPNLAESIRISVRWIGGVCDEFTELLDLAKIKYKQINEPSYTEFLKLRSTTLYGVNIEYARYCKKVADDLNMDFEYIKDFDRDYNKLYKEMGDVNFQRYILNPPEGKIGGHCVAPNAKILDEQYPDEFLKRIYKDNI